MRKVDERGERDDIFRLQAFDLAPNRGKLFPRRQLAERLVGLAALPGSVAELGQQNIDRPDFGSQAQQVALRLQLAIVDIEDDAPIRPKQAPGIVKAVAADAHGFPRRDLEALAFPNLIYGKALRAQE
jgi:hypothetical protein